MPLQERVQRLIDVGDPPLFRFMSDRTGHFQCEILCNGAHSRYVRATAVVLSCCAYCRDVAVVE